MITKNQTKNLFYLDRDTDVPALVDQVLKTKRSEAIVFLNRMIDRLNEKDAGEYYTLEDILRVKDGELEKMMRFFRGAVVPYYVRQTREVWTESIPSELLEECTIEIKRSIGFLKYDYTGHITNEVNSLATFERIKDFNEFITMVQEVCFDDDGLIFPDSEHFKNLEKEKGRDAAQRQVFYELLEKVKNKHYKRQLNNNHE